MKELIRQGLNILHLDLTKNLKYDRLTKSIISKAIKSDSICIDVGCHKGEILDLILKQAPHQAHYAFEPIPFFYNLLKKKYDKRIHILPFALSDSEGAATFQYVKNAPAYSGLKNRNYDVKNPIIEEIPVEIKTLDSLIPAEVKISFVKIDVEGGELGVIKGAINTFKKNKPIIIFECGIGASDYYGTKPEEVYSLLNNEIGLNISLLDKWLNKAAPLSQQEFCNIFNTNSDYYFIAHQ